MRTKALEHNKSGNILVKTLYKALESGDNLSFPLRSIWNMRTQPDIAMRMLRL